MKETLGRYFRPLGAALGLAFSTSGCIASGNSLGTIEDPVEECAACAVSDGLKANELKTSEVDPVLKCAADQYGNFLETCGIQGSSTASRREQQCYKVSDVKNTSCQEVCGADPCTEAKAWVRIRALGSMDAANGSFFQNEQGASGTFRGDGWIYREDCGLSDDGTQVCAVGVVYDVTGDAQPIPLQNNKGLQEMQVTQQICKRDHENPVQFADCSL